MKAKIIKLNNHPTCKEVLLYAQQGLYTYRAVKIIAWHALEDHEEMI